MAAAKPYSARRPASLVLAVGLLCAAFPRSAATSAADEPPQVDFKRDVLPIFKRKCLECHGEKKQQGGLDMSSRRAMLEGGHSGPALVPGEPDESLMIELIEFDEMPPRKEKDRRPVTEKELKTLRAWIAAGAESR